jgi:circadian clock protein KaiC
MLTRLIDFLKNKGITSLFTSLTSGGRGLEHTDMHISSLIDSWLLVRDQEADGERTRVLYLLKSRGMAHSNQVREFRLTPKGIQLIEVYAGTGGVLTGSARAAREAQERAMAVEREQQVETQVRRLEQKRLALEAQVAALRAAFDAESAEEQQLIAEAQQRERRLEAERQAMARRRAGRGAAANSTKTRK